MCDKEHLFLGAKTTPNSWNETKQNGGNLVRFKRSSVWSTKRDRTPIQGENQTRPYPAFFDFSIIWWQIFKVFPGLPFPVFGLYFLLSEWSSLLWYYPFHLASLEANLLSSLMHMSMSQVKKYPIRITTIKISAWAHSDISLIWFALWELLN